MEELINKLNDITDLAFSVACDSLEKKGYFFPIAFSMDNSNELQYTEEFEDDKNSPESIVLEMILEFKKKVKEKKLQICAIISNVKIDKSKDLGDSFIKAISLEIFSIENTFQLFLPYKVEDDKYIWGNVFQD